MLRKSKISIVSYSLRWEGEISSVKRKLKLIGLICCFIVLLYKTAFAENSESWIKATKADFVKDGKPFKFVGASAVNLVFYDDWNLDIEKAMHTAGENNISVLRVYIDLGWGKIEDFDRFFAAAAKYGVQVILAFTDCCCSKDYPDLEKYFRVHAPFCNITNRQCVLAFKKLIREIIERKNSVNGRIYRDDPAIFAWEIANELEYWHFTNSEVYNWVEEIAGYIKSLDKNHLVSIGINTDSSEFIEGDSLYKMFNIPALDFFAFHFYPSSERLDVHKAAVEDIEKIEFITKKFISLGKPVVMGEFGFSNSIDLNNRIKSSQPKSYNAVFKEMMDSAFLAGSSGVMFWGWGIPAEKNIPMWWSKESHTISDRAFCDFIKKYKFPAQ